MSDRGLIGEQGRAALAEFVRAAFGADSVSVGDCRKLSGGAIQENWLVDLDIVGGVHAGGLSTVVRTDAPSGVAVSHSRADEFQLLSAAFAAGVTVPEPLLCCESTEVIGKPFVVMRRIGGTALGQKVTRDLSIGGDRELLTERLGEELARIHSITPTTHSFDFLPGPEKIDSLNEFREHLDALGEPRSALEWGLRWLEINRMPVEEPVLLHHDFRTGNYMVDGEGLTGVLDWEFAGWGEPHEDIGWFCAMCWRFGQRDKPAGGIGSREALYRGYERVSGRTVDPKRVYFWEVFAHIRWAVIAVQQGHRFLKGGERTLDIVLTGRRPAEIEYEILRMTPPDNGLFDAVY
ncbi:phosphotransferase family protein [Hwanghaeella sp.]|uniref:phosphotransferase family protein n=1 Tax=Hwanghaeella sp. TaxID=2605943 RepID=UPI003CCBD6BF